MAPAAPREAPCVGFCGLLSACNHHTESVDFLRPLLMDPDIEILPSVSSMGFFFARDVLIQLHCVLRAETQEPYSFYIVPAHGNACKV